MKLRFANRFFKLIFLNSGKEKWFNKNRHTIAIMDVMPVNDKIIFFNTGELATLLRSHEFKAAAAISKKKKMVNNLNRAGCLKLSINGSV